ncbi:predicted protein [Coccidioides posadasii str. Silveira]|uniref:Predicted protein n=1 Tax=Coccidioides posadasii (strain RMSCC 757 / Silveira) TaxID=443226 RepID=E9D8T8_COCPS|nr:predicted protein [Coccidioides posadasii str. Silveira]
MARQLTCASPHSAVHAGFWRLGSSGRIICAQSTRLLNNTESQTLQPDINRTLRPLPSDDGVLVNYYSTSVLVSYDGRSILRVLAPYDQLLMNFAALFSHVRESSLLKILH